MICFLFLLLLFRFFLFCILLCHHHSVPLLDLCSCVHMGTGFSYISEFFLSYIPYLSPEAMFRPHPSEEDSHTGRYLKRAGPPVAAPSVAGL